MNEWMMHVELYWLVSNYTFWRILTCKQVYRTLNVFIYYPHQNINKAHVVYIKTPPWNAGTSRYQLLSKLRTRLSKNSFAGWNVFGFFVLFLRLQAKHNRKLVQNNLRDYWTNVNNLIYNLSIIWVLFDFSVLWCILLQSF